MTRRHGLSRGLSQAPPSLRLTRAIGEAGGGGGASAFSAAKAAIVADAGDVNILVIGDSTGNETTEWVYLFADWLGDQYPTHSVDYYLWGGSAYGAASSLSTGSGANKINVWNCSVAGSSPNYVVGSLLAASVVNVSPDCIIWNHGQNIVTDYTINPALCRGRFLQAMEQVRQALPGVPHAAVRQNPRRDDNQMAGVVESLDAVAALYGDLRLIDVYARFIAAGKPSGWYADNVHPNATGSAEWVEVVKSFWRGSASGAVVGGAALLDTSGTNLLNNADFGASYAGGTPSGWSTTGTPTGTVENTIVEAPATQSMQVDSTAASSSYTFSFVPSEAIKGSTVTLAVRQYVPASQPATAGRIAILYTAGSSVSIDARGQANEGVGGWRWQIIQGVAIPSNATLVRVYLYADTGASAGTTVYYDRAVLVAGSTPRDRA